MRSKCALLKHRRTQERLNQVIGEVVLKLKKHSEYYRTNDYKWVHHIDYENDELSLKKFSKEEQGYCFTFNIVTYDKTDDARDIVKRKVAYENIFRVYPYASESFIDLTFLMHKAMKIMRENPDLATEIILVSTDSYGYDDYDGTFAPSVELEEDGKADFPNPKKKKDAPKV